MCCADHPIFPIEIQRFTKTSTNHCVACAQTTQLQEGRMCELCHFLVYACERFQELFCLDCFLPSTPWSPPKRLGHNLYHTRQGLHATPNVQAFRASCRQRRSENYQITFKPSLKPVVDLEGPRCPSHRRRPYQFSRRSLLMMCIQGQFEGLYNIQRSPSCCQNMHSNNASSVHSELQNKTTIDAKTTNLLRGGMVEER